MLFRNRVIFGNCRCKVEKKIIVLINIYLAHPSTRYHSLSLCFSTINTREVAIPCCTNSDEENNGDTQQSLRSTCSNTRHTLTIQLSSGQHIRPTSNVCKNPLDHSVIISTNQADNALRVVSPDLGQAVYNIEHFSGNFRIL